MKKKKPEKNNKAYIFDVIADSESPMMRSGKINLKILKMKNLIDFQEYLERQLKNPRIKKHYDEYGKQLEIAYKILRLRKQEGVSQAELAKRIGTKQSDVARMEAGEQNFTTETLQKIASAFRRDLKIEFAK